MGDALEIAQTLLGLSKAPWDEDDDEPDAPTSDGRGHGAAPTTPSPSSSVSGSTATKPSRSTKEKNEKTVAAKKKIKHTGVTRRALNALHNFYQRAEELQTFKRLHDHCNVPQTYPANQPLANWVARMRREKKKLEEDKQSMLDQKKVEYLEKIGFEWGQRRGDELWNTRYQQLKDFFLKHRHTRVPTKAKVLGRWVSTQRDEWRKLKMQLVSALDDRKVQLLNEIEFCWDCHMQLRPYGVGQGCPMPAEIITSDMTEEERSGQDENSMEDDGEENSKN